MEARRLGHGGIEYVAGTDLGTPVSPPVVRDWLEEQGLALHQIEKALEGGGSPDRAHNFNASPS